jgi:hypothetical protein
MPGHIRNADSGNAVLVGGPMDGREYQADPIADELVVVMEDGARYVYVLSQRVELRPDGRLLPVYEYRGRDYPLKSSEG